jgi:hypothetical protein
MLNKRKGKALHKYIQVLKQIIMRIILNKLRITRIIQINNRYYLIKNKIVNFLNDIYII